MEIVKTRSIVKQPHKIVGPTVTIVNTNEVQGTEQDEEGVLTPYFEYDSYRFKAGEYELVQVGFLPAGAEWDDVLRSIERKELYDYADGMIAKYTTDVPDSEKRDAWVTYKHEVRTTQEAEGYPRTVSYPARPE